MKHCVTICPNFAKRKASRAASWLLLVGCMRCQPLPTTPPNRAPTLLPVQRKYVILAYATLAFPCSIASEPSCSGGGGSSTGGSSLALGLGPLDVLGVDVGQGSPLGAMVAAGGVPSTAAAAPRSGSGASAGGGGGGAGALGPASPPQDLDLIAVDWAEAVTLPLVGAVQAVWGTWRDTGTRSGGPCARDMCLGDSTPLGDGTRNPR